MSISTTNTIPLYVDSNFSDNNTATIKGANVTFLSGGVGTQMDAVYLEVIDSEGTITTLTEAGNPPIYFSGASYFVDSIDITGYPDGNISLIWTGELSSTDYVLSSSIAYGNTVAPIVLAGIEYTTHDATARQNTNKTYSIRLQDRNGVFVDGNAARFEFRDRLDTNRLVTTVSASLHTTGSGLWTTTYNHPESIIEQGVQRYEIVWFHQLLAGGSFYEVQGSRHFLTVTGDSISVETAPLAFCDVQDVRTVFPNIDKYLLPLDKSLANRNLLLQNKIYEVSLDIDYKTRNREPRHTKQMNAIKYLTAYQTALDIVSSSSDEKGMNNVIKHLTDKRDQYLMSYFGKMRFVRVN